MTKDFSLSPDQQRAIGAPPAVGGNQYETNLVEQKGTYDYTDTGRDYSMSVDQHQQIKTNASQTDLAKIPEFDPLKATQEWVKPLVQHYAKGGISPLEGNVGVNVMLGNQNYEDGAKQINQMKQTALSDEEVLPPWDIRARLAPAVEALPTIVEMTKSAAIGAGVGAAFAGTTAVIAGQAGPQAASPEEVVTVPSAMIAGASFGGNAGSFISAATQSAGQFYMGARAQGIPHDAARVAAVGAGVIGGILQTIQIGKIGKAGTDAAIAVAKPLLPGAIVRFAKEVGVQIGLGEAQTIANDAIQAITALAVNNKEAIPTPGEILQHLWETFVNQIQVAPVLLGGAKATGTVLGKAINAAFPKTPEEATAVLKGTLAQPIAQEGGKVVSGKVLEGKVEESVAVLDAQQTFEKAKEEYDKLKIKSENAADQIALFVDKDLPVPEGLAKAFNETRKRLKEVIEEKKIAELNVAKQQIEEKVTAPSNDLKQLGALSKDLEAVTSKLYQAKISIATQKVETRLNQVEASIKKFEGRLTETIIQLDAQIRDARIARKQAAKNDKGTLRLENRIASLEGRRAAVMQLRSMEGLADLKDSNFPLKGQLTEINKLLKEQSDLKTLQGLLDEGLIPENDLAGLNAKISFTSADSLIKLSVRKIIKAQREAKQFTKQDIRENQQLLTKLIRKSGLSQADQGRFLDAIRRVQTAEQLEREVPKIEERIKEILDAEEKQDALDNLERVLKETLPAKRGKKKRSKVNDPATQAVLDTYRDYIKNPEKAVEALKNANVEEARYNEQVNDAIAQGKIPAPPTTLITGVEKVAIAYEVLDLKKQQPSIINQVAKNIETILDTGKSERLEAQKAKYAKLNENLEIARKAAEGTRPSEKEIVQPWVVEFFRGVKRTGWTRGWTNTYNTLVGIIFQHAETVAEFKKAIGIFDVSKEINNEIEMVRQWTNKLVGFVTKDNKKALPRLMKRISGGTRTQDFGTFINQKGSTQSFKYSRVQAIGWWMRFKDPDLKDTLRETHGFTFKEDVAPGEMSTEHLLEKILNNDDKQIAQGLMDFYQWSFVPINEHHLKVFGWKHKSNPFYSGEAHRVRKFVNNAEADVMQTNQEIRSIVPGSTIERTGSKLELKAVNPVSEAFRQLQQMAHWITFSEKAAELNYYFHDRQLTDTIDIKFKGALTRLNNAYMDIVGLKQFNNKNSIQLLDQMRANIATAFIGLKLDQLPKQFTAVLYYLHEVEPGDLLEGMSHAILNPEEAKAVFRDSSFWRNRSDNLFLDLKDAARNADIFAAAKGNIKTLKDWGMILTQLGDRTSIAIGGYAVYRAAIKRGLSHEQAVREMDRVSGQTQSSSDRSQLTELDRFGGSFGKMFLLFSRQNLQAMGIEANQMRRAISNPTWENLGQAAKTWAAFHAATALFQLVGSAFRGDLFDDQKSKEAWAEVLLAGIAGPAGGAPLFMGFALHAALQPVTDAAFGAHNKPYEAKELFGSTAGNATAFIGDLWKLTLEQKTLDTKEIFTILKHLNKGIIAPATGLPFTPILDALEKGFERPK